MRLKRIRIENYRRIQALDVEVRRHLVLVGPNDSGKSSVVRALNLLLGSAGPQLVPSFSERDFSDLGSPIVVEATLGELTEEEKAAFPDEVSVGPPAIVVVRLEARFEQGQDSATVTRSFPDAGHGRGPNREQLSAIAWRVVPADRLLGRELSGERPGLMRSVLSSLELGEDELAIREKMTEFHRSLDEAEALLAFRGELAGALSSALPRSFSDQDVRLLPPGWASEDPLAGTSLGVEEDGRYPPLGEQSDGVRSLAAFAVYSMMHQGANLLAIDEPEMHLHPTAQRAVGKLLRSARGQRIVATHSSTLLSQMDPVDIVAFGPARVARQLSPGRATTDAFALRWWRSRILEPLTANKVILVEGVSDRILLEAVASQLHIDLDRLGIHVFELDGSGGFVTAHELLGQPGFGLRLLGVVDEAEAADWSNAIGIPIADLEVAGYRICRPDLEGEYLASLGAQQVLSILTESNLLSPNELANVTQNIGLVSKYKVKAASALALQLDKTQAQAIRPLAEILELALA